jgi:glutathione S-transferase
MTALPELHGFSLNPRVMAARLALVEKGVAHQFRQMRLADLALLRPDDLLAQFSRAMPSLVHGDLALYELEAILRYVDEAFPGPSLQPAGVAVRAEMTQLMAIMRDHLYPCAVEGILVPRLFAPLLGRQSEASDTSLAELRLAEVLGLVSDISENVTARPGRDWLLGSSPSLADMLLAPVLRLLRRTPEGRRALSRQERLSVWLNKIGERAWLDAVLRDEEIR